jgi:hypothetical protein
LSPSFSTEHVDHGNDAAADAVDAADDADAFDVDDGTDICIVKARGGSCNVTVDAFLRTDAPAVGNGDVVHDDDVVDGDGEAVNSVLADAAAVVTTVVTLVVDVMCALFTTVVSLVADVVSLRVCLPAAFALACCAAAGSACASLTAPDDVKHVVAGVAVGVVKVASVVGVGVGVDAVAVVVATASSLHVAAAASVATYAAAALVHIIRRTLRFIALVLSDEDDDDNIDDDDVDDDDDVQKQKHASKLAAAAATLLAAAVVVPGAVAAAPFCVVAATHVERHFEAIVVFVVESVNRPDVTDTIAARAPSPFVVASVAVAAAGIAVAAGVVTCARRARTDRARKRINP